MTKVDTNITHEIAGKVNTGHEKDVTVHKKTMASLPQELVWEEHIISIAMFKITKNNYKQLLKRETDPAHKCSMRVVMSLTQPKKREVVLQWSTVALKSERLRFRFRLYNSLRSYLIPLSRSFITCQQQIIILHWAIEPGT